MPELSPADEMRQAAAKVRAHAEIFGAAAEEIATLLDTVAEVIEQDDGTIDTSTDVAAFNAARAINASGEDQ